MWALLQLNGSFAMQVLSLGIGCNANDGDGGGGDGEKEYGDGDGSVQWWRLWWALSVVNGVWELVLKTV